MAVWSYGPLWTGVRDCRCKSKHVRGVLNYLSLRLNGCPPPHPSTLSPICRVLSCWSMVVDGGRWTDWGQPDHSHWSCDREMYKSEVPIHFNLIYNAIQFELRDLPIVGSGPQYLRRGIVFSTLKH